MKNVIIPGAGGNVARHVIAIIEGDVLNLAQLKEAIAGQGVVYANLAGDLEAMAKNIVRAMDEVDYETTRKGEPEKGSVISQKSLAKLIKEIIESPERYVRENLGVNKPNS